MDLQLFSQGKEIINKLNHHGHEAYFVGGCVRDYLLKRPVHDIDLVTSATPIEIERIFKKTIPLGIEHGTMIVRHNGQSFELTTYRYEDKIGIKHLTQLQRLKNDLSYRDFTMNAIAMNKEGMLIDPFNGVDHIKQRQIQGVKNPNDRLLEDPLRILRALRFVSELDFSIDPTTFKQMKILGNKITTVAVERLTVEFTKLLNGKHVEKAFNLLVKSDIHQYLPTIKKFPKIMLTLKHRIQPLNGLGEFFAICNHLEKNCSIESLVTTWKTSRKIKQTALHLYAALIYNEQHAVDEWLVYQLTEDYLQTFVRINHILQQNTNITYDELKTIYDNLPIHSSKDIKINGRDLLTLIPNQKPGKWMRDLLRQIEKNIVKGKLSNHYQSIKEWVMCHPPENN